MICPVFLLNTTASTLTTFVSIKITPSSGVAVFSSSRRLRSSSSAFNSSAVFGFGRSFLFSFFFGSTRCGLDCAVAKGTAAESQRPNRIRSVELRITIFCIRLTRAGVIGLDSNCGPLVGFNQGLRACDTNNPVLGHRSRPDPHAGSISMSTSKVPELSFRLPSFTPRKSAPSRAATNVRSDPM